jgi:two-component system cell cycle sensor histidine kinase/response regulator CckA
VVIKVSDTGHGIPPHILRRIFDPFFTKPLGKGTGLGLSTVFGIVQNHGGFVNVDSVPAAGTSIRVGLPAIDNGSSCTGTRSALSSLNCRCRR